MPFGDALKSLAYDARVWAVERARAKAPAEERTEQTIELITAEPFGSPPRSNARELTLLYNTNPWVRSIVSKVSKSVAKQGFYLENSKGERVDAHPALDFLKAGSPRLRGRAARQITSALLDLTGECFWIIGRNSSGQPVQYAPIPPNWAVDIPTEAVNSYRIQPRSGVVLNLDPADVLHFKDPDPVDPYGRGSPYTGAASVEIATDEAAADMLRAVFKNRARPDIVVTGTKEAPIDAKERPNFETSWMEKFRGPKRAGRPFFSSHPIEIKEIGNSLRDNAIAELREQGKNFIREFYGAPPEIFGVLENSNRATIDSADYLFGKHTVDPRLTLQLDYLEPFLRLEFGLQGLTLRFESAASDDLEFALKVVQARPAAFSNNEVRALAKHKPLPGQDDLPEPVDVDPAAKDDASEKDDKPAKKAAPVAKVFNADDVVFFSGLHEDPQVRAEATRIVDELLGALIAKFGGELLEELVDDARFVVTGQIAEFIAAEVPGLLGRIDETTRKDLRASLVEGVARGENVAALLSRVEDVFKAAADIRAPLIGDTVATKIAGFATQVAAEQAGFDKKKWLSTRDQLVRSTHASLDGQTVARADYFTSSAGYRAKHPGAFGVASEDVNCRCAMRPIIEGEDESKAKAGMSDAEFVAFYSKAWQRTSDRIAGRFRDIFAAQQAVIAAEMRRRSEFRA